MFLSPSSIKRFFIACAIVLATVLPTLAEENIISQVTISKAKDGLHSYELNIDSTQMVQYKSRVDSDGNVVFDLKNSTLAKNMGTIYDDVIDIDNVTVKQLDNNRVRIYVNGKDAQDTELVFVNSVFETSKDSAKKVIINRPIAEYKSTSHIESDLELEDDATEWDDNSFNFAHLSSSVLTSLKEGMGGKVIIILSLLAILSTIIKTLAMKIEQEKEPLIGLNNAKVLNNNEQIGSLGLTPKMLNQQELQSVSNRNEALKKAQVQLAAAHEKYQQYLQNKYQTSKVSKNNIGMDAVKKSIALNQYQKSTQNPYKNQEVIKFSEIDSPKGNYQIPPRPKMQAKAEFTSPYIKKTNNFVTSEIKKEQPNMKFLDSVSKIYERSGRADLADGLKNSISKAKQTI